MRDFAELVKKRRSVRLMSGEPITNDELKLLFEAFRWAPSSYNDQPWRVIYGVRGTKNWEIFLSLLEEGNRAWAKHGAVILIVLAKRFLDYKHKPARHHWFDCGAACQNLALQAADLGLAVCVTGGFDERAVCEHFAISRDFDIPVMIILGRSKARCLGKLVSSRKTTSEIFSDGEALKDWRG